jgi:propionyl-CoA synthetase
VPRCSWRASAPIPIRSPGLEDKSGLPVIDHWWQTELGWPAIATCFALGDLRRKRGSAGLPGAGLSIRGLG